LNGGYQDLVSGVSTEDMSELTDSLNASFPATAAALPVARRAVVTLARRAGATEERVHAIRLAVSEALTNVVLHAYRDRAGDFHLTAVVAGGELWVLVADDGCGLRPGSDRSGLGLGLALIAQASDELTIVKRSGGGTELRMRFVVGVPAGRTGYESRGSVASATSPAASVFSTTMYPDRVSTVVSASGRS